MKNINFKNQDELIAIVLEINILLFNSHLYIKQELQILFNIIEINMDKIMNMWYHGDKKKALEYKYFLMLDLEPKDLDVLCKGDKMMEKYKEKIEKLNEDPEFIEVVSKEKDAEMFHNTLIKEGATNEKYEIAKNLLDNNVSIDIFIKSTGLSKEEIEELKSK